MGHLLRDAASERPEAPAVAFEEHRLNYAQYVGIVGALARRLGKTVRPGDRVVLLMQNTLDLAVATFAVHALRAQVVALNPAASRRELEFMLADAAPVAVVLDERVTPHLAVVRRCLPAAALMEAAGGASFVRLLPEACPLPLALPAHRDLASLQYTGGTTGRAKGVNILHRQLAWNLAQREAWLPTRKGKEVVLCTTPLFHVSAVAMCLHQSVHAQGQLVIHRRFKAEAVLEAVQTHQVTLLPAVPAVFHDLLRQPSLQRDAVKSLRACYSGAAPLPEQTLRHFEELTGCPIHEGYGLSEAGPCLAFNPVGMPRKAGTVGLPVPGGDLQVVDLESGTREVPAGSVGEIRVRGPQVMSGYRNLPLENERAFRDGWFYTGDLAHRDQDGYIVLHGRRHDVINVGGFSVYPLEIEKVLRMQPEVGEAAAFAVQDDRLGEVVHAWVTGAASHPAPDADDLMDHCRRELAAYKVPRRIGIIDSLPRTAVGKLARNQLAPVPDRTGATQPSEDQA